MAERHPAVRGGRRPSAWIAPVVAAVAALAAPGQEPPDATRVGDLVGRLGSPAFRDREAAARDLRRIGGPALPALAAAAAHPDPEVRVRAVWLRLMIRAAAARAFLNGYGSAPGPGWGLFRATAGDDRPAREVYLAALAVPRARDILTAADRSPADLDRALAAWRRGAPDRLQSRGEESRPPAAEMAVVLAAAATCGPAAVPGREPGRPDWSEAGYRANPFEAYCVMYIQYCDGTPDDPNQPVMDRAIGRWLDTRTGPGGAGQAFRAAVGLGRPAGRYAVRVLRDAEAGRHDVIHALLVLSAGPDEGTPADALAAVAGRFSDRTPAGLGLAKMPPAWAGVQVRDVALATAALMTGRDPHALGLVGRSPGEGNPNAFWFVPGPGRTADDLRAAALARWKAWDAGRP